MPQSLDTPRDRQSPPTDRVVGILEALAADPGRSFTAAELSRRLGISSATCHAILATLTTAGFVMRGAESKRYRLGPAAIAVGRAAEEALSPGRIATSELQRLCDKTQGTCNLRVVADGSVVVLERFGHDTDDRSRPGSSYPFAPPFGFSFAVWGPEHVMADWIEHAPVEPSASDLARLEAVAGSARRRGYLAHESPGARQELFHALMRHRVRRDMMDDSLRGLVAEALQSTWVTSYILEEHAPSDRLEVSTLSAPIFRTDGEVPAIVELRLGQRRLTVDEIDTLGRQLASVAGEITRATGASDPWALAG